MNQIINIFFDQVKVFSFINMAKLAVYMGYIYQIKRWRFYKIWFSTNSTQPSIQQRTFYLHQKKIRERRLLPNWGRLDSTPSKALLLLSLQPTHINASGTTFQTLRLLLLLLLFQLNIKSLTVLWIAKGVWNHLKFKKKGRLLKLVI